MPASPYRESFSEAVLDDDGDRRKHASAAHLASIASAPKRSDRRPHGGSHPAPLPGLTAVGAALPMTLAVTLAATLDAAISPGLGLLFGFVFVLSSIYAALRLSRYDAWAAVALPPLVFVGAAGLASQMVTSTAGDWVTRTSTDIAAAVLQHPLYLIVGTVLAALMTTYRARIE